MIGLLSLGVKADGYMPLRYYLICPNFSLYDPPLPALTPCCSGFSDFFVFPEHTRHASASGPLPYKFPLSGMPFSLIYSNSLILQAFIRCNLLTVLTTLFKTASPPSHAECLSHTLQALLFFFFSPQHLYSCVYSLFCFVLFCLALKLIRY